MISFQFLMWFFKLKNHIVLPKYFIFPMHAIFPIFNMFYISYIYIENRQLISVTISYKFGYIQA